MSNISQDQRPAPASLDGGNTIVYVQYTTTTGFQWGTDTGSLVPLSTTIDISSSTTVTFEFLRYGFTPLWYKIPPTNPNGTAMPTASPGPTIPVAPNTRSSIGVATSSGGPYSTGYVKVSDDGFDRLLGNDDEDEGEDEGEQ